VRDHSLKRNTLLSSRIALFRGTCRPALAIHHPRLSSADRARRMTKLNSTAGGIPISMELRGTQVAESSTFQVAKYRSESPVIHIRLALKVTAVSHNHQCGYPFKFNGIRTTFCFMEAVKRLRNLARLEARTNDSSYASPIRNERTCASMAFESGQASCFTP
jgi:hypothetical protein